MPQDASFELTKSTFRKHFKFFKINTGKKIMFSSNLTSIIASEQEVAQLAGVDRKGRVGGRRKDKQYGYDLHPCIWLVFIHTLIIII